MPRLDGLALASLVLCLACLAALAVAARSVQPPLLSPGEIAGQPEGARVVVTGAVRWARASESTLVLSLCLDACARVVAFRDARERLRYRVSDAALQPGAVVAVEGVVQRGTGGMELRALAGGAFDVLRSRE